MLEQIKKDIIVAMKAKNTFKVSVLRMLKNSLDVLVKNTTPSEAELIAAVRKEIKQHQDSFEGFKLDNRLNSMEDEERAIEVLKDYLPKELSQEEITNLILESIAEIGTPTRKQMGQVIKIAVAKANGRVASSILSTEIGLLLK